MLLIYDDNGVVSQAISHGSFDLLQAHYESIGLHTLMAPGNADDLFSIYIKDGAVATRPDITITAPESLTLPADGVTELVITLDPPDCTVAVIFQNQRIALETITDGTLAFSTPHAGDYDLIFAAAFPYKNTTISIKAV